MTLDRGPWAECETWHDDTYLVKVDRDSDENVTHLGVRRRDGETVRDWRALQRIKNIVAGEDVEAVELYPRAGRVVDTANIFHLWCAPPGVQLDIGMDIAGRLEKLGEITRETRDVIERLQREMFQ